MLPSVGSVDVLPAPPVHALSPIHSGAPIPHDLFEQTDDDLARSASFTNLPAVLDNTPEPGIKRTFSENVLSLTQNNLSKSRPSGYIPNKELLRRASRPGKSRISVAKFTLPAEDLSVNGQVNGIKKTDPDPVEPGKSSNRSVAGRFRSLARKSWISSTSRSPSPSPKEIKKLEKQGGQPPAKKLSFSTTRPITPPAPVASRPASRSARREDVDSPLSPQELAPLPRQTPSLQTSGRPLSVISAKNKSETELRLPKSNPQYTLRSRASSDRINTAAIPRLPSMKVPPMPASATSDKFSDKLSVTSVDITKKKDPLWGAFRTLEGDYQKFQAKSSSLKANVIRASLIPFLSRYMNHPSNKSLRSEDLDRRISILNKWWTGLLEMLNGRNNQSISGTDRPTFLEAVTGIMTRAEWRLPPFPLASPADTPRARQPSIPLSRSTTSLESSGSDFLAESIFHNVRNIFVQNLLSQMAFVVDKMSMRNAPASLVAFCGKACAYAFAFCPGVGDILVRLWHIPPESLRRVLAEFGVARGTNLTAVSKEVTSQFPPPLRSLALTSHVALVRHLQHKAPLPLVAAYIRWYGPWVGRWSGRDSDLFFVFTKHFHVLVSEYLSEGTPKRDRACVPGLVPVHAQILTILETTLYRQAGQAHGEGYSSSTVDDLDNPDATATIPLTIANAARSMAENRLIMLLRDLLADTNPDHSILRQLYAESFNDIVKAAARRISLYNNDACFVLCDFMEEVLVIMSRYHQSHAEVPVLDWPFWLGVCRKMVSSRNSLTEVRLFAFVYSTWNILISNADRRRELCLDWLLEPEFFERNFNHWCPMVRGYYLRLLCWRVARYDGDATDLDTQIYEALARRLNTSWAHYLYLRAEAEKSNSVMPSSAPCSPAPGRRLVIIRNDSQPLPANVFSSFGEAVPPMSSTSNTSYRSHSSILHSIPTTPTPVPAPAPAESPSKKRWSVLKNILPFSSPGNARPGEVTPPGNTDESPSASDGTSVDSMSVRSGTEGAKTRPVTPPHQPFSFKFSLEWLDRPLWPSRNKRLSAPRLPPPAQILLQLRQEKASEVGPQKPRHQDTSTAKYAGRALAEWAQIVSECQNFFDRRKEEGVPSNRLVETPTLGVESFRMYG